MSTTTVCRELKSLSKPQVVVPITLRLTLARCKSDSDSEKEGCQVGDGSIKETNTLNSDFGGWSFIESLTKEAPEDKETPYVHPLDKSFSSKLSNKSLEVCTESLGSETGSDIGDDNDPYLSSSSSDSEATSRRSLVRQRSRFCKPIHKKETRRSFPPPLTSINGSDYVQYTPRREGGRLVITANPISSAQTCFLAKRGDGRLRLHFKNSNSKSSSDEETDDDKEVKERERKQYLDACLNEKIHGEMAIVKYQRPFSWCKDSGCGNKRLLHLNPFLGVAI